MINHDDLVVEGRSELGVSASVHADVGTDVITPRDVVPPFPENRPIQSHTTADNGYEAAAGFKTKQRLFNVTRAEVCAVSLHAAAGRRKRRVHHHGVIQPPRPQQVVQPFGIESCRCESLQEEQANPSLVNFIGIHLGSHESHHGRDVAGSRTRFENLHPMAYCCCACSQERLSWRRAELLSIDLILVTPRLSGQPTLFEK